MHYDLRDARGRRHDLLGVDDQIVALAQGAPPAPAAGVVQPRLIFGAAEGMRIVQEEIFGPLLPVIPYNTLDEAIERVNAGPAPLALYYFDHDPRRVKQVINRTLSGGVTVNDCVYHFGQKNLPFGGVGRSGMGAYRGRTGFETFSKSRGIMVQPRLTATALLSPPSRRPRLVEFLLRITAK